MIRASKGGLGRIIEEIEGLKSERLGLTENQLKDISTGSTFYEIDTKDKYKWESSSKQWYIMNSIGVPKYTIATTKKDGLISKEMVKKLEGIEEHANNYIHPENHQASIIVEDENHRFVTDKEKEKWNTNPTFEVREDGHLYVDMP